jgi:hypothetical protein
VLIVRATAVTTFAVAPALGVLYAFPPESSSFYWRCPFHAATGLLCPGCGGTRAVHALVHGHLSEALSLNPLAVVLLVVGFLFLSWNWCAVLRDSKASATVNVSPRYAAAICAVVVVFTIARNLVQL